MWKTLETNSFHIFFCLVSGLCCLLPLCLRIPSNIEQDQLRMSLSCPEFAYTSFASLAAVIPLLCDVFLDILSILMSNWTSLDAGPRRISKANATESVKFTFLNIPERMVLLIGVMVVPLVAVLPMNTENLGLIYLCCNKCQKNLLGGAIASSLCRHDTEFWPVKCTLFCLAFYSVGLIGGAFLDNILAARTLSSQLMLFTDLIITILTVTPSLALMLNSIRWLIIVYFKANSWRRLLMCSSNEEQPPIESQVITFSSDPDHTFFPMIYIVCATCLVILVLSLSITTFRIQDYNSRDLILHNIPIMLFVICLNTLSMRMVKAEILESMYALIDSKKSYVRYISHELRTPLNTAFLGIKLLSDSLHGSSNPKDVDRREILADVSVACRTTLDILNDLLCFNKMESGILVVNKHEVSALSFIFDCVSMFSAQAREAGVTVKVTDRSSDEGMNCEVESLLDSDTVFMDRFKMDQVLRNLISNALKFTPRGGSVTVTTAFMPDSTLLCIPPVEEETLPETTQADPPLSSLLSRVNYLQIPFSKGKSTNLERISTCPSSISETSVAIQGKLTIVVKDSGTGMLEKDYSRLFKEIVQFNPEVLQAGGGSGLGLWITKGIVDLHHGDISVYSEGLGRGTSFTVQLPMERVRSECPGTLFPSIHRIISTSSSLEEQLPTELNPEEDINQTNIKCTDESVVAASVYHLLIVDDSSLNRKMLLRIFRTAGHTCDEAEDGVIAVAMVKETMSSDAKAYSAILMDFVMPNMDGPTATRIIRASGYTAPIFGVTGNTLDSDIDYFLNCGADKVLPKPFNLELFYTNMRES